MKVRRTLRSVQIRADENAAADRPRRHASLAQDYLAVRPEDETRMIVRLARLINLDSLTDRHVHVAGIIVTGNGVRVRCRCKAGDLIDLIALGVDYPELLVTGVAAIGFVGAARDQVMIIDFIEPDFIGASEVDQGSPDGP